MGNIKTLLGLIIFKWDDDIGDNIQYRIKNIIEENDNKFAILKRLDCKENLKKISYEELKDMMHEYQILKSDGILSVSVVTLSFTDNKNRKVRDIRLIWFKNDSVIDEPDFYKPTVIASQALADVYATMIGGEERVGISVPTNALPTGYTVNNFLIFDEVLTSKMYHIYKTDTLNMIANLTGDNDVKRVLIELYGAREQYLIHNKPFFDRNIYRTNLDGYCRTYKRFLRYTGFVNDLRNSIGISNVSFEIEEGQESLDNEQKQEVSVLYGGIRIEKTFIYNFKYDIDLSKIKMKYLMIMDNKEKLYVIGYTEYPEDIPLASIDKAYKLTQEKSDKLQAKLKRLVAAYDSSNHKNKDGKK